MSQVWGRTLGLCWGGGFLNNSFRPSPAFGPELGTWAELAFWQAFLRQAPIPPPPPPKLRVWSRTLRREGACKARTFRPSPEVGPKLGAWADGDLKDTSSLSYPECLSGHWGMGGRRLLGNIPPPASPHNFVAECRIRAGGHFFNISPRPSPKFGLGDWELGRGLSCKSPLPKSRCGGLEPGTCVCGRGEHSLQCRSSPNSWAGKAGSGREENSRTSPSAQVPIVALEVGSRAVVGCRKHPSA